MTEEHDLARPRTTPQQRISAPSFAAPKRTGATHPLDQLAPDLEEPWIKEETETPDRTTNYTHSAGHRVGLRLQPGDLTIQTWITAGPDLPPIPAGTDEQEAQAQAESDARLQPGRSWHATVATRHTADLPAALASVLREQLLPALTNKPKRVLIPEPKSAATGNNEPKAKPPTARKTRTTPKKKGTEK
ncbi:hypothetical protein [Streptomyces sp. Isolate_219]|uniref:hypothetical protein n=1 Tax=Streptomyces sp. Isolate_219 TaxID=2950110 RepID=UPI0021C790F1|nr:hypothetical protein [Streptomyces sp. Isolate_219]MCR8573051.1 hypothetical protein [Streptomyces sp. Isolate_219]